MIFLDTSAIYAMADQADPQHGCARERFQILLDAGERVLTHNYVLVEAMALIQSRLGMAAALKFARDCRAFEIEWVDEATHEEAVRRLGRAGKRRISLVDQVSFLVMQRRGVNVALALDPDFELEGFQLFDNRRR
jgi:predicted nucleic acid-binding protein